VGPAPQIFEPTFELVAVGGGVGRVIKLFDKLPINLSLSAYYNSVHPSSIGPSWQLRSQLTFIF